MIGERFIRAAEGSSSAAFRCLGSFAQGLFVPSGKSLVLAIVLVFAGIVAACVYPWDRRIAATGPEDWMRRDHLGDEHRRITVLTVKGVGAFPLNSPQRPLICFIGASNVREALPVTAGIEKALLRETGRPHDALLLAGSGMPTGVKAGIIERLGTNFDGAIIVGINRHTFGEADRERSHWALFYGFESSFIDDVLDQSSWTPLIWRRKHFFIDGFGGLQNVFGQRGPFRQRQYVGRAALSELEFNSGYPNVDFAALDQELAVLARGIQSARKVGARAKVVFVDCPFGDEYAPRVQNAEWRRQRDEFDRRMTEWSRAQGVSWWNFSAELPLVREDFADRLHLFTDRARTFYVQALAKRVRLLEEGGQR